MIRHRRGMSLVEVMVVIAIMLVLMTVIGFGAIQVGRGAKVDMTELALAGTAKDVDVYAFRKGVPTTSQGLAAVYGEHRIPADGWGAPIGYEAPGPATRQYDLLSLGEDGAVGGDSFASDIRWSESQ